MNNTPLTFRALAKEVTISLQRINRPLSIISTLYYKIDDQAEWIPWNVYDGTNPSFLEKKVLSCGQTLQLRGVQATFSKDQDNYYRFDISDEVQVKGNVMSLVNNANSITNPYQFYKLFQGCDKIMFVAKDLLPATVLTQSCYEGMFKNCYGLKNAPDLPASKLFNKCYAQMFKGCINLINTPILPARELAFKCYNSMFEGCISLRAPSQIFAQKLATKACNYMFYGCKKIKAIKVHFKHWINEANENWLSTTEEGTFYKYNSLEEEYSNNRIPRSFKVIDLDKQSLTFIAVAKDETSSIALVQAGKPNLIDLYYSLNYQTWMKYIPGRKLVLKYGDVISFKNNSPFFSIDRDNYYNFVMTGKIKAIGKVESLINFRGLTCGCFTKLFDSCSSLTTAPTINSLELVNKCYESMFRRCSSLVDPPVLPASELKNGCYFKMFEGCSSLIRTPFLPAMKLASNCYEQMFKDCTSLEVVSDLPAFRLYPECYKDMFKGCSSLVTAPVLESISLATSCYTGMFAHCISLVSAPQLPATILTSNCYFAMFAGCTSLINAPELPAIELAQNCYTAMFKGCSSLINSPLLPAKEIQLGSYQNMFEDCTSLSSVSAYFRHWSTSKDTFRWLANVAESGTFYKSSELLMDDVTRNCHTIPATWEIGELDDTVLTPITFTALTDNVKISIRMVGQVEPITLKKMISHQNIEDPSWQTYNIGEQIILNQGESLFFKGEEEKFSKDFDNYYRILIENGEVTCSGSVNSLIGTDQLKPYIFTRLFEHCVRLVSAPTLDSLVVEQGCYKEMFRDCTVLTSVPQLPAKVLAPSCYERMFYNCDSLTEANLPDAIMNTNSCKEMFGDCDSLLEANLPSKFIANGCYDSIFTNSNLLSSVEVGFNYWNNSATNNWLANVAFSGVFKKPLFLKVVKNDNAIPASWSVELDHVTNLPLTFKFNGQSLVRLSKWGSPDELKHLYYRINNKEWLIYNVGTALTAQKDDVIQFRNYDTFFNKDKDNYYHFEFKSNYMVEAYGNIMSLVNYATEIEHDYQFAYLFVNCKNLSKAPVLPATELKECCYYNMFNTTCITEAPALPASTIAVKCYLGMFANCSVLSTVPQLPATEMMRCCYRNMFKNCIALTAAPELPAPELFPGCYANMFNGCKNLNYIKVNFTEWLDVSNNPTTCWLNDTATSGTFQKPYNLELTRGVNNIPQNWEIVDFNEPQPEPDPIEPDPGDDPIDPGDDPIDPTPSGNNTSPDWDDNTNPTDGIDDGD